MRQTTQPDYPPSRAPQDALALSRGLREIDGWGDRYMEQCLEGGGGWEENRCAGLTANRMEWGHDCCVCVICMCGFGLWYG